MTLLFSSSRRKPGPSRATRTLVANPASIGAVIILFWIIVAIAAPLLAPYSPTRSFVPMSSPSIKFILGTDYLGRDILSRIIHGARTVLFYAPTATLSAYIFGVLAGLVAGYTGGKIDEALSRVGDAVLAFPVLVLYIIIVSRFGSSGINIILATTLASGPGIMRIVRGLVLDLRGRAYVLAAETRGERAWWIMLVEILPNARGPLIVDFCLRLGYVTIAIGTLGFLGIGLPPPTPDWGSMIYENRQFAMVFPHMIIFPCIAVSSLVLGFNLLADGLREMAARD
jgi:ABC-type dipeptide/oligopeptide/nickel transport system permease subunit